jgi:formylmethanofuran dehydrogenase subunit E
MTDTRQELEEIQQLLEEYVQELEKKNTTQKQYDDLKCKVCGELYPFAQPNQPDGETLICYACRIYRA